MSRSAFVMREAQVANDDFEVHNLNNHGDGGGSGMTERLERLEKKVDSMESTLSRLNDTMIRFDGKVELQSTKFTGALDLQSQKLSAALELQSQKLISAIENQSILYDGKLKDLRLSIILWILGLPSLVIGLYKIYETLKPA
ncbi:TPA: hypothetical protein ACGJ08_004796 [Yersinia enterocolitica]